MVRHLRLWREFRGMRRSDDSKFLEKNEQLHSRRENFIPHFSSFFYYSTTAQHSTFLDVLLLGRQGKDYTILCWRHVDSFVSENEKHLSYLPWDLRLLPPKYTESSLSMLYDDLIVCWKCEDVNIERMTEREHWTHFDIEI